MNKRWELHLAREEFEDFTELLESEGFGGFTSSFQRETVWIICYPSEEIKVVARLRFHISEIVDKYGIDVDFTDWPKPE